MKNRKNKIKIALLGSYPPPYGGVSVHIKRLHQFLTNKENIESYVYNFSSTISGNNIINMKEVYNWLKILFLKQDIYHCHITSMHWVWLTIFYVYSKINRARFIITYHSLRFTKKDFALLPRIILKQIFNDTKYIVVSNNIIKNTLKSLGANCKNIKVIPAFIPDTSNLNPLPNIITEFIQNHSPVLSSYAYSIINIQKKDLYGVKMIIEACYELVEKYPNIGFVVCITHSNKNDINAINTLIKYKGISDNILVYNKAIEGLHALWGRSDIYLRPTLSDGDSVALRESIYLKTPSIASDCVKRPPNVILFKNDNVESFIEAIVCVLNNYSWYKNSLNDNKDMGSAEKINSIYQKIIQ